MDYSEMGRRGAKKFWERFYKDEVLQKRMREAWNHPKKDPVKAHKAAIIAAKARWKGHAKKKKQTKEKRKELVLPPNTQRNIFLRTILCAYLTGDGSVTIRKEATSPKKVHYDVRFYPDDKHMVSSFLSAFKELYGREPRVIRERGHYRVHLKCKIACLDLIRFTKFNSLEWRIPEFINTEELKKEWLRAFFDCESYVNKSGITLQSVNKHGLMAVQKMLREFSIESRLYSYERKQANWNTNYILTVMKKTSRINFLKNIGFTHSKKQAKLEKFTPASHNLVVH